MKKIIVLHTTIFILVFGITLSWGQQTVSKEAQRCFDRGVAAVDMAKTTEDYAPAIKEFEQAASLAPDWPDVYYNLGLVQEKAEKYSDAVTSLQQYLRLAPDASEAETVKTLINKLEFKVEKEKELLGSSKALGVLIPAGEFLMGSPKREGEEDERPQHKVFLDAYYIDKYEVTVAQYRKFCETTGRSMPEAPSWGWQDNHPMVNVSWEDATAYAQYYGKRLPTEAEWEKAARAGSTTRYYFGDAERNLKDYAWYVESHGKGSTRPIGTKKPNTFGLYDMYGNAWEWCADWYANNYYRNSPTNNPKGPASGQGRVLRGGCWLNGAAGCRSAIRGGLDPADRYDYFGFRCAVSP